MLIHFRNVRFQTVTAHTLLVMCPKIISVEFGPTALEEPRYVLYGAAM